MDKNFTTTTLSFRGKENGQRWLNKIPKIIKKYELEWGIKSLGAFPELSLNYVEKIKTQNGQDGVLKIAFPNDPVFAAELRTLKIYNGEGAVKVLKQNVEDAVFLMERCLPGDPLYSLNSEEKEIEVFSKVCKKIRKKVPAGLSFQKLSEEERYFKWYFDNPKKSKTQLSEDLVKKAYQIFKQLIKTQTEVYLLHSDLHHDNIIKSQRGWLAIDPKGLVGEKEFEAGAFIINPGKRFKENADLITENFFAKRIELISKTSGLKQQRVADWAFVKVILAIIWSIQDNVSKIEHWYKISRELEKLV